MHKQDLEVQTKHHLAVHNLQCYALEVTTALCKLFEQLGTVRLLQD